MRWVLCFSLLLLVGCQPSIIKIIPVQDREAEEARTKLLRRKAIALAKDSGKPPPEEVKKFDPNQVLDGQIPLFLKWLFADEKKLMQLLVWYKEVVIEDTICQVFVLNTRYAVTSLTPNPVIIAVTAPDLEILAYKLIPATEHYSRYPYEVSSVSLEEIGSDMALAIVYNNRFRGRGTYRYSLNLDGISQVGKIEWQGELHPFYRYQQGLDAIEKQDYYNAIPHLQMALELSKWMPQNGELLNAYEQMAQEIAKLFELIDYRHLSRWKQQNETFFTAVQRLESSVESIKTLTTSYDSSLELFWKDAELRWRRLAKVIAKMPYKNAYQQSLKKIESIWQTTEQTFLEHVAEKRNPYWKKGYLFSQQLHREIQNLIDLAAKQINQRVILYSQAEVADWIVRNKALSQDIQRLIQKSPNVFRVRNE